MLYCAIYGIPYPDAKKNGSGKVLPETLVIGGGIAGIQAALEIADSGNKVYLVERTGTIGGHMAMFDKTFPTLDCAACILTPKMVEVGQHPNIELMTMSEVIAVKGTAGNYEIIIHQKARYVDIDSCTGCNRCIEVCPSVVTDEYNHGLGKRKAMVRPVVDAVPLAPYIDMENCIGCQSCAGVCEAKSLRYDETEKTETITVGAVIVATGFEPFDPSIIEDFGYGENPDVITSPIGALSVVAI